MTVAQARRIAVLLRDYATSLPYALWSEELRIECFKLAVEVDKYAEWKQVADLSSGFDAGWTE